MKLLRLHFEHVPRMSRFTIACAIVATCALLAGAGITLHGLLSENRLALLVGGVALTSGVLVLGVALNQVAREQGSLKR